MARPRQKIKRDRQLNLSLTGAEYERVQWGAMSAAMTPADYGRWRLLGARRGLKRPQAQTSGVDRLFYVQLKRIGNNLNQLTRLAHVTRAPSPPGLEPLLQDIRALLRRGLADGP